MGNYRVTISVNDQTIETLVDILPETPGLKMLIVAKTPTPVSVKAGHYFQGTQGQLMWRQLTAYGILHVPKGDYEDDHLLEHGYGITDIVKVPRNFGSEPSAEEYREGCPRILKSIAEHKPHVLLFVYKGVLDKILKRGFGRKQKSQYGFNPNLEQLFNCRVFALPLPGVGRQNSKVINKSMSDLAQVLKKI